MGQVAAAPSKVNHEQASEDPRKGEDGMIS